MVIRKQAQKNTLLRSLGISFLYFAAAQFGLSLELDSHQITHYWPASGVALAALLFYQKRALPGIALGILATFSVLFLQQPFKPTLALLFVTSVAFGALVVQPLIAVMLLRRFASPMPFWTHISTFYRGLGVLLVASVIPAAAVAGALYMAGLSNSDNILSAWILWTMANFLGMATIAPLLYHIARYFDVTPGNSDQAPLYTIITFSLACLATVVMFIATSNIEETGYRNILGAVTNGAGTAVVDSLNMSKPLWASIATLIIGLLFTHIVFAHEKNRKDGLRTKAFHEAIVVSARQPFVHLDENGIVLEWNNAAHLVFGWTLDQIQGRKLSETLIPNRFKEAHENGMERFRSTGEGLVIGNIVELEASCADGTELPIELLINAIQTEDGWHFFAFIYDISARRTNEYALQAAHDKYTGLFEANPDAIITYDQKGNIEDANAAAIVLFGWSRDEILNMNCEAVIADQSKAYFHQLHNNADDANPLDLSYTIQPVFANRRDGSEFPFEAVVNTQKTETGIQFVSVIRDITDQVEAQKIRDSNQKLETLGELTGVLAHEFNNLLAIIIGNLDLAIAHETGTTPSATMRDRLNAAHNAAMRGSGVVKSLLAVGTDQPMPKDRFDVVSMMEEILPTLQVEVGKNIALSVETTNKSLLVNSNRSWLSEAVQNIAINAREAVTGHGQIKISLESTHSSSINDKKLALSSGEYVVVKVSDTGSGMSPSAVQKSFEPFFTTKKASGHKGIGLSMVARIAKQLGGAAAIASEPGRGTIVHIFLPKAESYSPPADDSYLNSGAPRQNILVVDDQTDILKLVVSWLEKSGHNVQSASNADVALKIINSTIPCIDLLITDMIMPSMNGDSLSQFARKRNPDVKILYMTGFLDRSQKHSFDDMDAPVLEKPFRKDTFLAAVNSIFDAAKI